MKRPKEYVEGGIYVVHTESGNHVLEGRLVKVRALISNVVPYVETVDAGPGLTTLCGKANLWLPESNKEYKSLLRR